LPHTFDLTTVLPQSRPTPYHDKVTLYAGIEGHAGTGDIWAINPLVTQMPSSGDYNAQVRFCIPKSIAHLSSKTLPRIRHPGIPVLIVLHLRASSSTSTTKTHTVEMLMLARGLRHLYSPFDPLENPRS
jgi:hypothetical protein